MQTSEILKTGIVLRCSDYKEADAMVNALGKDGFFSFRARGIRKLTSKNAPAVQPFSYSQFSLFKSNGGGLTLKEASPVSFYGPKEDLAESAVAAFLQELTLRIVQEDEAPEAFPYLLKALELIKSGKDPLTMGLLYFAKVLSIGGYGLEVGECVLCHGKRNVVSLSYEEGGFVCADDFDPSIHEKTPVRIRQITRFLFRCEAKYFERVSFSPSECLLFYKYLAQYLENLTGVRLKSVSLLSVL